MKKQFILCFVATTLLFCFNSCKTENEPSSETSPVYLPMAVGNYWIYQHFIVDSLGNELSLNQFDSVVIMKDTLINNKLYYEFRSSQYDPYFQQFLRDSLGYVINNVGKKFFSTSNSKDILYEIEDSLQFNSKYCLIYKLETKMESDHALIKTDAGEFNTLNARGFLTCFYYDNSGKLTDTIITDQNTYYAQNVGIVVHAYHYYTDMKEYKRKFEKRLIRYKIKE